ncbi:MAG TPA: hypothetical protein VL500_05735 [Candidatus Eisenbacteria bacterium]|jgi:hypothetical protein|nr:hypothetical protein [Candidatus Eisenbacteria bacterium]
MSQKLTNEQIKKITQHIASLDAKQKKEVESELKKLKAHGGGVFYKKSLDSKINEMRHKGKLSEIDRQNLKNSLYGEK